MTTNGTRESQLSGAFVKLADTLVADFDVAELLQWLVEQCTEILDTQAGCLMIASPEGQLQSIASTSEQAELVEMLQLAAGEGPSLDCFSTGTAIAVSDIEAQKTDWPAFSDGALAQGFRSVHITPMRLRGQTIGTMNLFSIHVGALALADIAVAQALADVATIGILQERTLRSAELISAQLQHALRSRIVIEQAKGILGATRGMSMSDAFSAMRVYARNRNLTMKVVAEGVVAHNLYVSASLPN